MEPTLFFCGPPNLDDLCCFTVAATKAFDCSPLIPPQIIKCKELIHTEPDVIASPSIEREECFTVILQCSLFKTGRIQARLQKQGLQMSKPFRVNAGQYQSCLIFTVYTRLSPFWNKAGEWLVQGRDFVNHDGYTNAIKMTLSVNREEIYVSLTGAIVKFPPLQLEDLELSRREMEAIYQSTHNLACPVELNDVWCHVLPSLKRGRVTSISLHIPPDGPFASYNQLKRHWKNMHGYRLPDTEDDVIYFQVTFLKTGGGKHFTYPNVCLRSTTPQLVPRVDVKPVLTAFLQDVHTKVGTLCGMALRFQPKLRYTMSTLHCSSQPPAKVNLSSKPHNKPRGPLRDGRKLTFMYNSRLNTNNKTTVRGRLAASNNNTIVCSQQSVASTTNTHADDFSHNSSTMWDIMQPESDKAGMQERSEDQIFESIQSNTQHSAIQKTQNTPQTAPFSQASQRKTNISKEVNPKVSTQKKTSATAEDPVGASSQKYVPLFRPKMKAVSLQQAPHPSSQSTNGSTDRIIPMFRSQTNKKLLTKNTVNTTLSSQNPNINISHNALHPHSNTSFNQDHNDNKSEKADCAPKLPAPITPLFTKSSQKMQLASKTPKTKPSTPQFNSKPTTTTHQTPKSNTSNTQLSQTVRQQTPNLLKPPTPTVRLTPKKGHSQSPTGTPTTKVAATPKTPFNFQFDDDEDFDLSLPATPKAADMKRKNPTETETPAKKPRAKQQVQNVDVELLARASQLSKVNTTTLVAWLKERGVACKSKDKKTDLVEKVNTFLKLTSAEQ